MPALVTMGRGGPGWPGVVVEQEAGASAAPTAPWREGKKMQTPILETQKPGPG